jgi:hypothetical protein
MASARLAADAAAAFGGEADIDQPPAELDF